MNPYTLHEHLKPFQIHFVFRVRGPEILKLATRRRHEARAGELPESVSLERGANCTWVSGLEELGPSGLGFRG